MKTVPSDRKSTTAARAVCLIGLLLAAAPLVAAEAVASPAPGPALNPHDVTMKSAGDYALAHNPELLAMTEDVRMAEANLRLARAADRIQASVNGYVSSATSPNMVVNPAEVMPDDMRMLESGQRAAADVRVTRSLSSGGRIGARVRQGRQLLVASEADLAALRLEVYYQTRAAYRLCLLRQKLVGVYRRDLDARQELLRVDGVKLEAGKIPLYYYLRDKTRLAEAQQQLVNGERDLELAYYDLSVLLGLERPQQLVLSDNLGYAPTDQEADAALAAAAANRPELVAVRARFEAAAAQISAAKAAYRPQLAATVIFDVMAGRDMATTGGYTAALVAGIPLADGGARAAEVAMAQAQQRQLTQRERQLALGIAREVLAALANLKAADQNIRTTLEARAAAEEDDRITRLRYDAGKAINLEPLDALAALVRARVDAEQALYEYNDAVDELHRAMGRAAFAQAPDPEPTAATGPQR